MKKLTLSRETIRRLDDVMLGNIKGGGTGPGATADCGGGGGSNPIAGTTSMDCCPAGKPDG